MANSLDWLRGENSLFLKKEDNSWQYLGNVTIERVMLNSGRILISEVMPTSRLIVDKAIKTLEVTNCKYGPRDNYYDGDLIACFSQCEFIQAWIPKLVIDNSVDLDYVKAYAVLKCDIEIFT